VCNDQIPQNSGRMSISFNKGSAPGHEYVSIKESDDSYGRSLQFRCGPGCADGRSCDGLRPYGSCVPPELIVSSSDVYFPGGRCFLGRVFRSLPALCAYLALLSNSSGNQMVRSLSQQFKVELRHKILGTLPGSDHSRSQSQRSHQEFTVEESLRIQKSRIFTADLIKQRTAKICQYNNCVCDADLAI
jgi:hypothetical protein